MTTKTIGLIGVGLLGSAIAERLLAAGYRVVGFDKDEARLAQLSALGGEARDSAAAVAADCRRILLSLPDSSVSAAVIDEIRPGVQSGAILIDTTTGDPQQMAALGELLAESGIAYLDATVAGSSELARRGEAVVMVGGMQQAAAEVSDVLTTFAQRVFHVGPCGAGARMKLAVNLVLGLNRAALAEGLAFAKAAGVDPAQALQVFRAGAAYSAIMDSKGEKMISGDFSPQARLAQHHKDVRLILAEGHRAGVQLPLSTAHEQLLVRAAALGHGNDDNSAIIRAYER